MAILRWTLFILFWGIIAAFLHYTLPQHDVVRITDTYEKRIDPAQMPLFWSNAAGRAETTATNRDVFFIQTRRASGDAMVYRNEDTGWGWPPYFKFDTATLQAEAADLRSTGDAPRWAVLRHYGWRSEFLSIYPNAVSVRAVDSPDVRIIPWMNIIILASLGAGVWALWVRWRRFRLARIDPLIDNVGDSLDDASESFMRNSGRLGRWLRGGR